MNYEFPVITHIDQVLEAIKGHDEFIVAEREGYTVINYMMQDSDTFPAVVKCGSCGFDYPSPGKPCNSSKMSACRKKDFDIEFDLSAAIRRECRGITFYSDTGKIASRKYAKFFNMLEKEETFLENVDFSKPHIVLSKLDGSIVTPFRRIENFDGEKIEYHTKMGKTEFSDPINKFVKNHLKYDYDGFSEYMIDFGYTPIYEWCASSIEQRIVITHKEDALILTGIRENTSGKLMVYSAMEKFALLWNIPYVEAFHIDFLKDPQGCLDQIRDLEGEEGIVIRFDDSHQIKVKGSWYCKIHKNKELINSEKAVAELIVNNGIDDVKSFLLPDDLKMVNEYEDDFVKNIEFLNGSLYNAVKFYTENFNRKEFALSEASTMEPIWKSLIFSVWDNPTKEACIEVVMKVFKKNCNTNKNFNNLKEQLFSHLKYGMKEIEE